MRSFPLPHRCRCALVACLALLPPAWAQSGKTAKPSQPPKTVEVAGRIVDATGAAVRGFEVGRAWRGDEKGITADAALKTDKDGRFRGEVAVHPKQPITLLAMDPARRRGGWTVVPDDRLTAIEIKVGPMTTLTGTFDVSRLKSPPETVAVIVQTSPDQLDLVRYEFSAKRKFTFRLPAGDYELSYVCSGGDREPRRVTIAKGRTTYDLGKIALRPTPPSKPTADGGKPAEADGRGDDGPASAAPGTPRPPPPLTVTEARGVPKDIKLADYRGKWVLIDFWGVWCPPCVSKSIPALLDFHEAHAADRDRYAILTVHCWRGSGPDTLAAMDSRLPELERTLWNGRKFPFPVLVDATRTTLKAWGVQGFPTAFLIDPDGNLVAQANLGLEERLAKELKQSRAKPASGGSSSSRNADRESPAQPRKPRD